MRRILILVVAVGLLAACGSEDAPELVDGGVALPVPTREESGSEVELLAEIVGVVELEEETGCVVLVIDGYRLPAVWPTGTVARRDPFRLVLPEQAVVREGDTVAGGGGYPRAGDGWSPEALGVRPECLEGPRRTPSREAAAFNPNGDVEVRPAGSS